MEAVQREHEKTWEASRKAKSLEATQSIIDQLRKAKESIATDPTSVQIALVKLQAPVKSSFEAMTASLKATRGGHNNYQKALDKLFRDKSLPSTELDALSNQSTLINRAVYLHLLREGLFEVADTMQEEAARRAAVQRSIQHSRGLDISVEDPIGLDKYDPGGMLNRFREMHEILQQLRVQRNLVPAMDWARQNSKDLTERGSNLGFELCRLQYTNVLFEDSKDGVLSMASMMNAMEYGQTAFRPFQSDYTHDIQELLGAHAFWSNLEQSPYHARLNTTMAWDEVAHLFTREFCALLELSADSPLYITATAGAIALPPLLKLQAIQKQKNASWTSANELPVETPLPPNYQFHSIFVCPVSKEQATDNNPPMMMPCGHVICQESLMRLAKGSKFKCPYCPNESSPNQALKIIL